MPIIQGSVTFASLLDGSLSVYTSPDCSESHATGATSEYQVDSYLLARAGQRWMKGICSQLISRDFTLERFLYCEVVSCPSRGLVWCEASAYLLLISYMLGRRVTVGDSGEG